MGTLGWPKSCGRQIFDENRAEHAQRREQLRSALTAGEYDAAGRTTTNAHDNYTAYVSAMADGVAHHLPEHNPHVNKPTRLLLAVVDRTPDPHR